ncbi:hypothetical protein DPV78_007747 [Talaromyces pinophilus]|nr:hypothetical protein DPV78_007747 [Talaromyces pinophilus]
MSNSLTDTMRQNVKGYMIPRDSYDLETFIEVWWLWIILPVCAVLGTAILLLVIPLLATQVQTSPEHDIAAVQNLDEIHGMAKEADVTMDQGEGFLVFMGK